MAACWDGSATRGTYRRLHVRSRTAYLSEESTPIAFLRLFADAHSLAAHFEGARERARAAFELIEPQGWDIYGSSSSWALESLRKAAAAAGVALSVLPIFHGRLPSDLICPGGVAAVCATQKSRAPANG